MNNREVALEFVKRFCAGDIGGLVPLLAEDLQFNGTFHRFTSAESYLGSLRRDPPEPSDYRVLSVTESDETVSVFWEYVKSDRTVTIAQSCKFRDGKIAEILLVFDGRERPSGHETA